MRKQTVSALPSDVNFINMIIFGANNINMKRLYILAAAVMASACISCCPGTSGQKDDANPVIENMMARRSIRNYKPAPVGRDTLDKIMECGINAPNGMNRQSWEIRIVDNPETMDRISDAMADANPETEAGTVKGCFRGAPVMIFIANDLSYDCSAIDCGLLSENIMLSAWSLGIGSVCLGSPVRFLKNAEEALNILAFSEGYSPIICIGLGYPDEKPEAKPRDRSKVKYVE